MSKDSGRHAITLKRVLFDLPATDAVTVSRDVEYATSSDTNLLMDIYHPPDSEDGDLKPAVVFVVGYSDVGFEQRMGCAQKEMHSYQSWARLVAAFGIIGITYSTSNPPGDTRMLFDYLVQHASEVGVDSKKIGIWSCSGSAPNALRFLMDAGTRIACAALCYGYMLDADESKHVSDAARQFGFTNPAAGRSVSDVPASVPMLIVRAGQDQTPNLNWSIDKFVSNALDANLPVSVLNYSAGPHAFDLFDDSASARKAIKTILEFLRIHLLDR